MALSPESDRRLSELMRASQAGDRDAYNALLNDVAELLRGYVAARTPSVDVAEDLIQEILVSIHRSRHTYGVGRPFAPWMYAITKRRIADYWRKQAKSVRCDVIDEEAPVAERPEAVSPGADGLASRVREALTGLPEKQQAVVRLLKLDGLSLKEAAARLQMTEAAVKVAAHRAYHRLRLQFAEINDGDR